MEKNAPVAQSTRASGPGPRVGELDVITLRGVIGFIMIGTPKNEGGGPEGLEPKKRGPYSPPHSRFTAVSAPDSDLHLPPALHRKEREGMAFFHPVVVLA